MSTKQDYYEILGIERNANESEIKSAYRKLAMQYHPDKNPGNPVAEEKFKEAAEAYSILSDSNQRDRYDRFGHAGVGVSEAGFGGGFSGFPNFEDIFGDLFGFGSRSNSTSQRGADLRYDLELTLEEVATGINTKIQIPGLENCNSCNGSGATTGTSPTSCSSCGGIGQIRQQQGFFSITRTCPKCRGTGKFIKNPCKECFGEGKVQKEKVLEIKIPAGVDTGSRLRVPGEGETGTGKGASGDLYVVIHVKEHKIFSRQENNLYCTAPISFSQAALGAEIKVPTLDGEEILKIPEGTQTGTTLRLRNKGIVSLSGRGKGDLLVTVNVVTPTKLSKEQRKFFEELASTEVKEVEKGLFNKVKDMFS